MADLTTSVLADPSPSPARSKMGLKGKKVAKDSKYSGVRTKSSQSLLTLKIMKGTHLLASDLDREPGTSDCVCFIWCGQADQLPDISRTPPPRTPAGEGPPAMVWTKGEVWQDNPFYTTKVVYETIDPTFNEEISIPLENVVATAFGDEEQGGGEASSATDSRDVLSRLLDSKLHIFLRDEDDLDGYLSFDELGMLEWTLRDLLSKARPMTNALVLNALAYKIEKTPGMGNLGINADLGTLTVGFTLTLEDDDVGKEIKGSLGETSGFKGKQLVERLQRAAKGMPLDLPGRPASADSAASSLRSSRDRGRSQSPSYSQRPSTAGSRPTSAVGARASRAASTDRGTVQEELLEEEPNEADEQVADALAEADPEPKPELEAEAEAEAEAPDDFEESRRALEGSNDELFGEVKAQWWDVYAAAVEQEAKAAKFKEFSLCLEEWDKATDFPEVSAKREELRAEVAAISDKKEDGWEAAVAQKQADLDKLCGAAAEESSSRWKARCLGYRAMLKDIQVDQMCAALPEQLRARLGAGSCSEQESENAINSTVNSAGGTDASTALGIQRRKDLAELHQAAESQTKAKVRATYLSVARDLEKEWGLQPDLPPSGDQSHPPAAAHHRQTIGLKKLGASASEADAQPEVTGGEPGTGLLRPKISTTEPQVEQVVSLGGAGSRAAMALRDRDRDVLAKSLEELTRITSEGLKGLNSRLTAVERSFEKESSRGNSGSRAGLGNKAQTSKVGGNRSSKENLSSQLSHHSHSQSQASRASSEGIKKFKHNQQHGGPGVQKGNSMELIHKTADGTICSATLGDEGALSPNRRSASDLYGGASVAHLASPLREHSQQQQQQQQQQLQLQAPGDKVVKPPPPAPLNGIFPLPAPLPAAPDWGRVTLWLRGGDMVSAYCEVLDRGNPNDFGRLLAEGGITPSALSVSVLNRACDQAALLLLQGPGQYTEVCLLFVLAILRDTRAGAGNGLLSRTKESLAEALQLTSDLPSKQGLLAGLLQTQLSR